MRIACFGIPKRQLNDLPPLNCYVNALMATTQLPPEFKRLLSSLNSNDVDYLVVGGYAVAYHGYVRPTGDIDVWVALTEDNIKRVIEAIKQLGYAPPMLKTKYLSKPGSVLRIGVQPLAFDIINQIAGVSFSECFDRRVVVELDSVKANVIGLSDLKVNKKASGRNKDLADLDYLP